MDENLTTNKWIIKARSGEKNLSGANFENTDLRGIDFSLTNLEGAKLHGANLQSVNLAGSNLTKADLRCASCIWTNLRGANLTSADLTNARVNTANLSNAKLNFADLVNTDLRGTDLYGTDFSDANLYATNFSSAKLDGSNFTCARLEDTIFRNLSLSSAIGLDEAKHLGSSLLDVSVLARSEDLPLSFLRGCGLSDTLIEFLPSIFSNSIEFYSCFISYSSVDREFANKIFEWLQTRGVRCWLDEKQLLPGDDIHDMIDHGIRTWDKVLLCGSKNSLTSWWVDDEMEKAFQKEQRLMKERGKKVLSLIPLNLDGYIFSNDYMSGKKSQLSKRVVADFTNWKDHDQFNIEAEKVVNALRADNGGRPPVPESKL